jgi:ABC-type transporter Mla subunit MlaD
MADVNERSRNNLRAGFFVVVTLALGVATFLALQQFSWTSRTQYRLRFLVENGVAGLNIGSEVRVGGIKRGRVLAIVPVTEDGRLTRIDVDFDLDSSITVYPNAQAVRVSAILGNTSWINFVTVGAPTATLADGSVTRFEPLGPNGVLDAIESPGLLTNIVGAKTAERFVEVIDAIADASTVLRKFPDDYDASVAPALRAANDTVQQIRTDYGRWRTNVDQTLANAEQAAANLERATRTADESMIAVRDAIRDGTPKIASTLDSLQSASANADDVVRGVKEDALPKLLTALQAGEDAIITFSGILDDVDGELAQRLPDIRTFLTDLRSAAGQLKLATIEVRRSPWRLLYRPSTDVLAHEQLYEATRAFVVATGDVRAASEGLQELLRKRPDLVDTDPELRDRLRTSLIDAVDRYEEAQRRLYGVLTGAK